MRLPRVRRARWLVLAAALAGRPALAQDPPTAPAPALEGTGAVRAPAPPRAAEGGDDLFDDDDPNLPDEDARRDPWEGVNRKTFSFNREVDRFLLDPITSGYQLLVPAPARRAIYRVFQNLDSPVVFANQLLQLRPRAAGTTLGRFVINSTAGIAGLFDAAAEGAGIERVEADFGQTLARYGTPTGPYLMLPLFGPSTLRDTLGELVDAAGDPLSYLVGPFQWWTLVLGTGEGLVVREAHVDDLNALEEGSIDFYSALRSAYLQTRDAQVREAVGASRSIRDARGG